MPNIKTTVYEPNYRQKLGLFKVWGMMFYNIVASRELIVQLFKRDFLMAYKKSFIGMGWIFLSPIIGIISWVFMNATGILNPGDVGIPYPAYVLISTSMWGLFMGFYSSAAGTLGAGSGFIMQVKYPHEALLIKQTAQHLANFTITFLVTLIVLLCFGIVPSLYVLLLPVMALPMLLLGTGLGLIVSVISVVASDLQRGFDFLLNMMLYVTPIIYSSKTANPLLRKIIEVNPLTYLVGGVRDLIIYGKTAHPERYFIASAFALVVFLMAWRLFYVSEERVIEKML